MVRLKKKRNLPFALPEKQVWVMPFMVTQVSSVMMSSPSPAWKQWSPGLAWKPPLHWRCSIPGLSNQYELNWYMIEECSFRYLFNKGWSLAFGSKMSLTGEAFIFDRPASSWWRAFAANTCGGSSGYAAQELVDAQNLFELTWIQPYPPKLQTWSLLSK